MIKWLLYKIIGSKKNRDIKKLQLIVDSINKLEPYFISLTDDKLAKKTEEFKTRYQQGETLDELLPEAYACVREVAKRTLNMRHFDVQLVGGIVLHQGKIAEMKTGEGKTLVATLPFFLNSLTGKGVHLVTVNDYLVKRDSEWMGPIYKFLGLTVGVIQHNMNNRQRREAYKCDVVYVTNNEAGFDYLRNNMMVTKEDRILTEHHYAIIDEVDSILVDEARTPLIISGPAEESTDKYYIVNRLIPRLKGKFITETEEIEAKHEDVDLGKGFDFLIDQKAQTAVLTEEGITKVESLLNVENLYDDIQSEWTHHISQALRAHNLFKRDVDYVIKDGEVIIVDEFTGRLMPGRRWSEGLHQAIEAKENLKIAEENQTLATVTFQNFFRLYKKLAGMTGTAVTEAAEFWEIYKLDVVEIPTNKPLIRIGYADVIYKTEKEKDEAIISEIEELYKKGRPVLVGTRSIEKSERLGMILKRKGIVHNVLNAKYHQREAEIISQAGRKGAVTIATNMAGRGTDIVLGGNPSNPEEYKEVVELEGLHILGTERHESRRIDNQLRGRSGRQGDPGSSRFYLSLEDELMRLFAQDKLHLMDKLPWEKGQNLESTFLSKIIQMAQSRVEAANFDVRKRLLEFDNVMNKQREVVYNQRDIIIEGEDLREEIWKMIDDLIDEKLELYTSSKRYPEEWNWQGINSWLKRTFNINFSLGEDIEKIKKISQLKEILKESINNVYNEREKNLGLNMMRNLERMIMLQMIDTCWKEHLYNLDQVRKGISLRAYGHKDPLIEYQRESYNMFVSMMNRISEETVEYLFNMQLVKEGAGTASRFTNSEESIIFSSPFSSSAPSPSIASPSSSSPLKSSSKIGRNDPCPCGSGKKYKKCCGK
ncbi:preprotein translocase subunit SecA [bacterium]|nr:preprotein translocase subunit SecA [bacterium]